MKSLLKLFWILGVSLIALTFAGCSSDDDEKNTESAILNMTFEEPVVVKQPVIDGTNIKFYVAFGAVDEDLKELMPKIEVSQGATVDPVSGTKVDFSGDPVKFTVTAEDGMTKTVYIISCQRIGKYDFEEWGEEFGMYPKEGVPVPLGGWSTTNIGAQMLMKMTMVDGNGEKIPFAGKLNVTQIDKAKNPQDVYANQSSIRIETLYTIGTDLIFKQIPAITTGSLFLGKFDITSAMLGSTLTATKFGIPYPKKPLEIRGYYKYTPGDVYYTCSDQTAVHLVVEDKSKTDKCVINAVLYEIETDKDEFLTGENIYTSDKLTAIAKLADGTAKSDYTAFSIEMDYKKPYDPAKKYRFAIICSSSAEGDTFSGAPGSVLYVDDIEIVSE